jgi:transcriptional regulator with XRE-family HTH domain
VPLSLSLGMTDERLMRLLGQRIKFLRQKADLTQEQMQDWGFNYRYYQEIESGTTNLTVKTINRLAKAFKVAPIEFFRFD